jgi:hypothetical protein
METKISVELDPLLPHGTYYFCDPCLIKEITHDERMVGARQTWREDGGWNGKAVAVRKGDHLIAWTTAEGDGGYDVEPNNGWIEVDSGNVGVASISVGRYHFPTFVAQKPFSLVRRKVETAGYDGILYPNVAVSAVTADGEILISATHGDTEYEFDGEEYGI